MCPCGTLAHLSEPALVIHLVVLLLMAGVIWGLKRGAGEVILVAIVCLALAMWKG